MRKLLIMISAALIAAAGLSAREYHVAKNGSDQNDGSAEAPFLTINKAAMILKTGSSRPAARSLWKKYWKVN